MHQMEREDCLDLSKHPQLKIVVGKIVKNTENAEIQLARTDFSSEESLKDAQRQQAIIEGRKQVISELTETPFTNTKNNEEDEHAC